MEQTTVGTILRLYPLGEDGLIVSWCTADLGIVRTAARGARRPGNESCGRIDLFHECELTYRPAKQGDLGSLRSSALLSPRLPLRRELCKLRLASYLCSLLSSTVEPEDGNPAWHSLLAAALDYLCTAPARPAVLERFERRMAELHGIYSPSISPHRALAQHFAPRLPGGRDSLFPRADAQL
ncbi:MAG: DNA repair protein RecO [Akkermansia sp.]